MSTEFSYFKQCFFFFFFFSFVFNHYLFSQIIKTLLPFHLFIRHIRTTRIRVSFASTQNVKLNWLTSEHRSFLLSLTHFSTIQLHLYDSNFQQIPRLLATRTTAHPGNRCLSLMQPVERTWHSVAEVWTAWTALLVTHATLPPSMSMPSAVKPLVSKTSHVQHGVERGS